MEVLEKVLQRVEQLESVYLNQKEILNFKEAVKFLSLSSSYVYKLTHQNKIPFYKPSGKNIYFKRQELQDWLLSNKSLSQDEIDSKATTFLTTKNLGGKKNA